MWLFDILHTADWHLGHHKVPASDVISQLREFFLPKIKRNTLVLFTGDFFDASVSINSDAAPEILEFFIDMLNKAHIEGAWVLILQGTYMHDRNQLTTLSKLALKLGFDKNVKFVRNMQVVRFDGLDKDILCIPDDLPLKKSEILDQAKTLLIAAGVKQADIVACHGEFEHTCSFGGSKAFTLRDFKDIVKKDGYILSGHYHTASRTDNMFYSGSFSRLTHGEEARKGFWHISNGIAAFVENKRANTFLTYGTASDTLEEILAEIDKVIENDFIKDQIGFLRLKMKDIHMRHAVVNFVREKYPHITVQFKKRKSDDKSFEYIDQKIHDDKGNDIRVYPTATNAPELIHEFLAAKYRAFNLSVDDIQEILNR